jgi:hypothetical protein
MRKPCPNARIATFGRNIAKKPSFFLDNSVPQTRHTRISMSYP